MNISSKATVRGILLKNKWRRRRITHEPFYDNIESDQWQRKNERKEVTEIERGTEFADRNVERLYNTWETNECGA